MTDTPKLPDFAPVPGSTLFEGYHYDPADRTLILKFANGQVWGYYDVPMERAVSLPEAQSSGRYFGQNIKGLYAERRLA